MAASGFEVAEIRRVDTYREHPPLVLRAHGVDKRSICFLASTPTERGRNNIENRQEQDFRLRR
jgi:hypothetical protein